MSTRKRRFRLLSGRRRTIVGLVLLALVVLWLLYHLNPTFGVGIPWLGKPDRPSDDPSPTESQRRSQLDQALSRHNVVTIRNEVYTFNGKEVTIDEMRGLLARLKDRYPDSVVELQTTGEEKIGMVRQLEQLVRANRLKLQSKMP